MKKQPDKRPGLHQLPPAMDCGRGSSWLPFFLMALGTMGSTVQAQEQVLSNYYRVLPQQEPVRATRVIKVTGEKGEKYDEVLSDAFPIQNHEIIQQARLNRLRALRLEAMELARRLKDEGESPELAYEEAWTQVYAGTRLSANGGEGDNRLDSLLRQLAEGESNLELADEDAQWLLEALMEDDSRLDSDEGRLLLSKLSDHLRASALVQQQEEYTTQDELMRTFADALVSGKDSMDAYRDALFKVNRGFIVNHPLVGYRAPWGLGLSRSKAVYQQAKNPPPSQTISSANTQPQTVPFENLLVGETPQQPSFIVSAGLDPDAGKIENFLATSPILPEDAEQDETEEEKELEEEQASQNGEVGHHFSYTPGYDYRTGYSRRAVAAAVGQPDFIWDGSTGNDTWKVNGDSAATPWQGNAVYTDGSHVTFSSTTAVKDVQLDGTVRPGSITVSGTTPSTSDSKTLGYNYAFTGHGTIADYSEGATSISVEGSATLVLNTANTFSGGITLSEGASLYAGCENATGTGTITMNNGSKLIVNYNSSDVNYRSPELANTIDVSGSTSISYGTAAYNDTQLPSEWRNLSVSGGITGSGTLNLYGYTYTSKPSNSFFSFKYSTTEYNYVSNFSINEKHRTGDEKNRFNGTVYLKNEFNHRPDSFSEKSDDKSLLGGAVQLTLVDNVFANATINLTRDAGERTVGLAKSWGNALTHPQTEQGLAMTSDNILVLSDSASITVKALEAQFLGEAWHYDTREGITATYVQTVLDSCLQADERKLARVVTDGLTTLVLDGSNDTSTHVFSGSMGFEQSYTKSTESSILLSNCVERERSGLSLKDPKPVEDCISSSGEGSHGVASLSLVKNGSSAQYIHSAKLNTLSLVGGTLGFNYLDLSGYLNLTTGTTLKLGVSGKLNDKNTWEIISSGDCLTSPQVTIAAGKELLVMDANNGGAATVEGSITMSSGSDLMFSIQRSDFVNSSNDALLQIKGSLTLQADTPINVSFSSVDFAKNVAVNDLDKFYYLVSTTDGISISGADGSTDGVFQPRFVSLGYGYYGLLKVGDPSNDKNPADPKHLYFSVIGDPSRTWSGNTDDTPNSKGIWTAYSTDSTDYGWKEKTKYEQGAITLFGNLYDPKGWREDKWVASSTSTSIVGDSRNDGTVATVTIDGITYTSDPEEEGLQSTFQKVEIVGDVAPATITINADYFQNGETPTKDGTNYYFYGETGYIRDARVEEIKLKGSEDSDMDEWKTSLIKSGTGTAVIATSNTFSGGTLLEGGRIVMQNAAALGDKEGGITIQNGAVLQGDYADNRSVGTWSSAYNGEGMDTTTIQNPVYVAIYVDDEGAVSATNVDARITGAHDKKLVLSELSGGAETVLTLSGNSVKTGQYTYSVFKVLDPGKFYGTIKMDGNLWGDWKGENAGGNVQLEIMTTEKATGGGNWLNAKIDLSVENGTERTVLALDALGTSGASAQQIAQVDSLHGACSTVGRMNSSVLNMSEEKEILLEIIGANSGSYQGVLGFGDFQKTVDYDSSKTDIGMEKHSYGTADASAGVLSVRKQGNATQTVYSAWIKSLAVDGGVFGVNEALVLQNLSTAGGTHLVVGNAGFSYSHAVVVGAGGVLAFDAATGSDVFANIGPGINAYTRENEDATGVVLVPPSSFVLLTNGSTISAHDDWKTTIDTFAYKGLDDESLSVEFVTDIAPGATVTVNTHNFTPDESIDGDNVVFLDYHSSHAIQLLGKMTGQDVHLIFNNELISAAAVKAGTATKRADGLGYEGATGAWMGYAAIRDIHQFTGDITVEGMTVLQVTNTNSSAASGHGANIDITVQGANAALQFTDTVTDQYINNLVLKEGGQLLLGGTLKTTTGDIKQVDETQAELKIQTRTAEQAALVNLDLKKTSSSKTISMGGTGANRTDVQNAKITTVDTAENYDRVALLHANLHNSVVQLHKDCSLDLSEAVLVDKDSAVQGASVQNAVISAAELQGPLFPTAAENEVTTSDATVVQLTLTNTGQTFTADGTKNKVLVLQMDQLQGVNVTGSGLTLQLTEQSAHFLDWGYNVGAQYVAIQVSGGSGQFLFEEKDSGFANDIDNDYKLMGADGVQITGTWVTATNVGTNVSTHLLYFNVPEPATTTLSLAALVALCARRRRTK